MRRHQFGQGEDEQPGVRLEDSLSEKTPVLTVRKVHVCPFNHNVSLLFVFVCLLLLFVG